MTADIAAGQGEAADGCCRVRQKNGEGQSCLGGDAEIETDADPIGAEIVFPTIGHEERAAHIDRRPHDQGPVGPGDWPAFQTTDRTLVRPKGAGRGAGQRQADDQPLQSCGDRPDGAEARRHG